MHTSRKVSAHMTRVPHAIHADVPLSEAQRQLRELGVAQLPVLRQGKPAGVLLERDLSVAKLLGLDLDTHMVGSLLLHDAFSVHPDESLAGAVRAMASRSAHCALVVEGAEVRGVLTTHDALGALAELLESEEASRLRDSGVCSTDDESCLLARAEELTEQILRGEASGDDVLHTLRDAVRDLYQAQVARLTAEERSLAFGREETPLRRSQLELRCGEHQQQAQTLEGALMALDDLTQPATALAATVQRALVSIHDELERERDPVSYVS